MEAKILKSLIEKDDEVIITSFAKVFKFDISVENVSRMISFIVDREAGRCAKRLYS